jgi:hypothetical protein
MKFIEGAELGDDLNPGNINLPTGARFATLWMREVQPDGSLKVIGAVLLSKAELIALDGRI